MLKLDPASKTLVRLDGRTLTESSVLEPTIAVAQWASESTMCGGFTFKIETPAQFTHFLKAVGEAQP